MTGLEKLTRAVEQAFLYLAGAGLLAIMLVIVMDVVLRYFFSAPLSWSFDLISLYLVTLVFFLALADTFRRGGHIRVDLFERLRATRIFAIAELLGLLVAEVFFALILSQLAGSGLEAFLANDVLDGTIPWPTWPPYLAGTLGIGLLMIRIALGSIGRIVALASGQPIAQEGGSHAAGEHVE